MSTSPQPAARSHGLLIRVLIALVLGYLQACAISWPGSGAALWWLQIAATAGLFTLLQHSKSARAAGLLGFLFALAWLCGTVWWLYISLHRFGGLASPLAALSVLALCALLSIYYGLAGLIYKHLSNKYAVKPATAAIFFIVFWLMAELARNSWFTGFPWGASGYAQIDGPLAAFAPHVGVYGVGALASLLACSLAVFLYAAWHRRQEQTTCIASLGRAPALAYLGCLLLLLGAPYFLPPSGAGISPSRAPVTVQLLQGNIAQGEKFEVSSGVPDALFWYRLALLRSSASLTITPETAIPLLPDELPQGYWLSLQQYYAQSGKAALIGMPLGNVDEGYVNAVVGLKPSPAASHYAYFKQHLVPFGEFIPPLFRWFTDLLHIPLGDFKRGDYAQASFAWAGEHWAPNICYEDLFGEELAARFVSGTSAPSVLVNMSNLAWFGEGAAMQQHRNISRMRSLELDRPMLRATNTGATVHIDRQGRVVAELARAQRGVLETQVQGNDGITFFAWWAGTWGQRPLWAVAFLLLLCTLLAAKIRFQWENKLA